MAEAAAGFRLSELDSIDQSRRVPGWEGYQVGKRDLSPTFPILQPLEQRPSTKVDRRLAGINRFPTC